MRGTVLNKGSWRRRLRVAKEIQFDGDVQEWWGEVLDKLLPGGLSTGRWAQVQEESMRGTPGYGLLDEYCVGGPSAHR